MKYRATKCGTVVALTAIMAMAAAAQDTGPFSWDDRSLSQLSGQPEDISNVA
jgi:hypothetical protein